VELHIVNCKPNDLAMIVRTNASHRQFLGRVVRVKALALSKYGNMAWETSPVLRDPNGTVVLANDECLRPIRWSGERDEMIVRLGKPERV
jgi:hypothetical protein